MLIILLHKFSVCGFTCLNMMVSLQTEDHELWATHFDSLQRKPPVQTGAPSAPLPVLSNGSERGDWEPSSSLSLLWDTSSCGAESSGAASVDITSGYQTRARYEGRGWREGTRVDRWMRKQLCECVHFTAQSDSCLFFSFTSVNKSNQIFSYQIWTTVESGPSACGSSFHLNAWS